MPRDRFAQLDVIETMAILFYFSNTPL